MIRTLCVSKGQGSEEVLWGGDWPEPTVSPGWTLYCLDVAGSDQHSHSGALRLAADLLIMASENNMCGRIHLTIRVWFDSRVRSKACNTCAADICLPNMSHGSSLSAKIRMTFMQILRIRISASWALNDLMQSDIFVWYGTYFTLNWLHIWNTWKCWNRFNLRKSDFKWNYAHWPTLSANNIKNNAFSFILIW